MRARYHGEYVAPQAGRFLPERSLEKLSPDAAPSVGFMFGKLNEDPANRLPESPDTIAALTALGVAMAEDPGASDSTIPAIYTYFGQFIDHDITNTSFDSLPSNILEQTNFRPISVEMVGQVVRNGRSEELDLESVYEGADAAAATNPDGSMRLGQVSPSPAGAPPAIPSDDRDHDLPRLPKSETDEINDRRALIGDPRNDENLIVAQLHVAFLRSHNALMNRDGLTGEQARTAMRRRYQWAVLHDFLPRVCDKATIDDVLQNGATVWQIEDGSKLFMPIEFAGAAYRFGHSMVRSGYSHNTSFPGAPFFFFFTFTALSGNLIPGPNPDLPPPPPPPFSQQPSQLPDNWIIDWPRFFSPPGQPGQAGANPARLIDTKITPPLSKLPDTHGVMIKTVMGKLAVRNLLRGYLLSLPTGQAVARHLGLAPLPEQTITQALPASMVETAKTAGLIERTPLWFYVLAEAGASGGRLGPVGSRIVAETLWNMALHATDSVLRQPPTEAELATGEFTLKGLVKIGQDTGMPPLQLDPPRNASPSRLDIS